MMASIDTFGSSTMSSRPATGAAAVLDAPEPLPPAALALALALPPPLNSCACCAQ
jgi:hypothetical protein